MKKQLAAWLAYLLLCSGALAQTGNPVRQSGTVTPGHVPMWTTNGVIQDGGTAARGFLTSLGVTAQGPGICQNSAPTTAPYNRLCLSVSTNSAAQITLQTIGGAPAQTLQFVVNGVTYSLPPSQYVQISNTAFYATRAGAIAASITYPTTNIVFLLGYTTVGDAPPAEYKRIPCATAVAWGFQSADKLDANGATCSGTNQNWLLNGNTLDVRQLGAVCDLTGSVDNTTVFANISAYINATNPAVVNFPHGYNNCAIWPTGTTLPNQFALFDLSDPVGLTINLNGACITTNSNDTDWAGKQNYVWFLRRAFRVTINDPCYFQTATTNPSSTFGGIQIQQIGAGKGLIINNGIQAGGLAAIIVINVGTDTFNGTVINNFYFDGVYYPLSFQHGANDVHAVGLYSRNHGRFYFPRNSKNHVIKATIEASGHVQPEGALIKVYCDNADTADQNTTSNIDLNLHVIPTTVAFNVLTSLSFEQVNAGNTCLNKGAIRDIKINLSGRLPDTASNNTTIFTSKDVTGGGVDNTARGYTVDGVTLTGNLTNTDTTSSGTGLVNLFAAANGSFSGETVNNIIIRDFVITSANGTAANNIIINGTSVIGLQLDNVSVRSQIAMSNIDMATTSWKNVRTSLFFVNAITTYDPKFGGGIMEKAGETALDGTNPTPVTTGLASLVACTLTIKGTAAPALGTSVVTYSTTGGTLNMYGWKPTGAGDATLIASTGTETIGWKCSGS